MIFSSETKKMRNGGIDIRMHSKVVTGQVDGGSLIKMRKIDTRLTFKVVTVGFNNMFETNKRQIIA